MLSSFHVDSFQQWSTYTGATLCKRVETSRADCCHNVCQSTITCTQSKSIRNIEKPLSRDIFPADLEIE